MSVSGGDVALSGELLKWTNYVHGWQVRWFRLSEDGVISYSLSEDDEHNSRGSIKIDKMILQLHKHSDVRFDIVTPSITWYLRAHSAFDRDRWVASVQRVQLLLPMSREGSVNLLSEAALQVASDLNLKLDELNSFKDSLSFQLAEVRAKLAKESPALSQQLVAVQATVTGIVAATTTCVESMQDREKFWQEKYNAEHEKTRKLEILYTATNRENTELIKSNAPKGPVLNEDQFFDAIEETLEKMNNLDKNLECLEIVKKKEDFLGDTGDKKNHRMYSQMQELINKYIELSKQDPEAESSWQVLSKSGETKIYRKEEQKGDVLMDFLVATTLVEGVTAAEMTEVFHSKELKLKWDHTIEGDKLLETLDDHCAVYHQILKRVWPAAQRDLVYASHKQQLEAQSGEDNPSWIVCNVSCEHPSKPESSSSYTRASIEVVMFCQTLGKGPTRKDVKCKIVYSASVNPGGWAPSAAVRAVSQREYPKFLKKISAFAVDHVKNNPVKF